MARSGLLLLLVVASACVLASSSIAPVDKANEKITDQGTYADKHTVGTKERGQPWPY